MGKNIREIFTDINGAWVGVGDRVRGFGVNEGLFGTVTAHNTDPQLKAFTVITDDGSILYFGREWTQKISSFPRADTTLNGGIANALATTTRIVPKGVEADAFEMTDLLCGHCGNVLLGFDEIFCPSCGGQNSFKHCPNKI